MEDTGEEGIRLLQEPSGGTIRKGRIFSESSTAMANTIKCKLQRCSGICIDRCNSNFQLHEFPEDILHQILSPLTFKELVQMSILSTKWRETWRSYPDLNFCKDTLNFNCYLPHHSDDEGEFIGRVNSILENYHCPRLNRFKVKFGLHKGHKDHLDRWVRFAIDSKSKHFVLNLTPAPECLEDTYVFPLHLFQDYNSCFLESLRLVLVVLSPPPAFCGLKNLKRIVLHRVLLCADLGTLLSACTLLEHMSLSDCFLSGFTLCEQLVHLRHFSIENCHVKTMELHATNLTSFHFQQREMPVVLDELLLLKEANIDILCGKDSLDYSFNALLNLMPNLQELSLRLCMERETKGWVVSPRNFIHLRHLKMEIHLLGEPECSSGPLRLTSLLEVAPFLEDMELHMCICDAPFTSFKFTSSKLSKDRSRIRHSRLQTFYMSGFYGCKGQIELARYILENATVLERMTVDPVSRMVPSDSVDSMVRLRELAGRRNAKSYLARSRFSQILTIL